MLPDTENYEEEELEEDLQEEVIPDRTYYLNFETKTIDSRMIDDTEAKEQAVKKMLLTEAWEALAYIDGYGRMFSDLIGTPMTYALSEAKDRIREAVLMDDRFLSVTFLKQEIHRRSVLLSMQIQCADGDEIEMEGVEINV